jgi:hypothetical protein
VWVEDSQTRPSISDPKCIPLSDPRISTFRGIMIDSSDDDENGDENASDSIRANDEFDSNVIDESEIQDEKHFDPRISTFLGIKID